MSLLLYGANGYTGQLITELAKDYALTPILAGRNAEKIKLLAKRHGLSWRVFDLDDEEALQAGLEGIKVVLHAAGPFMHTAKPMMQACLAGGVHYLDITGELPVFERAHRLDGEARERGITLMPGVGFDVVPTDCMALYLKHRLPDATHLKLAFAGLGGGSSHGTALTALESLGKPGAVRENGEIVKVEVGHKSMWVPFLPDKKRLVMTIPWGDVSTAYYTTGIPNIETYMGVSPKTYRWMKWKPYFNWLLRQGFVKNYLRRRIEARPAGPDEQQRQKGRSLVWGEVTNAQGEVRSARFQGPEGYTLTAHTSLIIARKVLNGQAPIGFQTPAGAFGEDIIMQVPGTQRENIK